MKKLIALFSIMLNVALLASAFLYWVNADNNRQLRSSRVAERVSSQFELLSQRQVDVVFLGDSITYGGRWHELFPGVDIANRGVSGNTTKDVIKRMDQVFSMRPEKLFIMVGINDLNRGLKATEVVERYQILFDLIDGHLPETKVYLQSVLPVNEQWPYADNRYIPALNLALQRQADRRGYTYIDLHTGFLDSTGQLSRHVSNDGIHLLGGGYDVWRKQIQGYVME